MKIKANVLTLAVLLTTSGTASGQATDNIPVEYADGIPQVTQMLELPAGETERVWKYRIRFDEDFRFVSPDFGDTYTGWQAEDFQAGITGSGPLELIVSIDGPPNACALHAMQVSISDDRGRDELFMADPDPRGDELYGGTRFRRFFAQDVDGRGIQVRPYHERRNFALAGKHPDDTERWADIDCTLTVALTRRLDRCVMYGEVSGDVASTHFGDVAYFVTVDPGTPIELGVALDPGMEALMDQLMGMATGGAAAMGDNADTSPAEGFGEACDESAGNCDDTYDVPAGSFSDALRQWAEEDPGEPRATAEDAFALTLTDVTFSDRTPDIGYISETHKAKRPTRAALADTRPPLQAFSLMVTAPGILAESLEGDSHYEMPLSTMAVMPGAFDQSYTGVKFLWENGGPGEAVMVISESTPNRMVGTLGGSVRSEQPYEDGYLWIEVAASFVALRGPRACQGQY